MTIFKLRQFSPIYGCGDGSNRHLFWDVGRLGWYLMRLEIRLLPDAAGDQAATWCSWRSRCYLMRLEITLLPDAAGDQAATWCSWRSGCYLMHLEIRLLPVAFGDQAATWCGWRSGCYLMRLEIRLLPDADVFGLVSCELSRCDNTQNGARWGRLSVTVGQNCCWEPSSSLAGQDFCPLKNREMRAHYIYARDRH